MGEPSKITVDEQPDGARALCLTGELSVFHAAELQSLAAGLAQETGDVRLECGALQAVDLAVVQVLLALRRAVSGQGRRFHVHGASREVAGLFELAGLRHEAQPTTTENDAARGDADRSPRPAALHA